jgi:hypothetical protein
MCLQIHVLRLSCPFLTRSSLTRDLNVCTCIHWARDLKRFQRSTTNSLPSNSVAGIVEHNRLSVAEAVNAPPAVTCALYWVVVGQERGLLRARPKASGQRPRRSQRGPSTRPRPLTECVRTDTSTRGSCLHCRAVARGPADGSSPPLCLSTQRASRRDPNRCTSEQKVW